MLKRRARRSDSEGRKQRPESSGPTQSDTFAWLIAAGQVVGPILAVLIFSVVLVYGIIHFAFLR